MTTMTVPIVGMLVGSTISGVAVALMAVLKEVQENRDKVETYLAFGASRIEVAIPIAQQALFIALAPVVNQMRCAHQYRGQTLWPSQKVTRQRYRHNFDSRYDDGSSSWWE
jgi:Uncharacterised protein family (UPF0014)